jgi:hypothetical protein
LKEKNKPRKTLTIFLGLVRINDKHILLGDKNEKN